MYPDPLRSALLSRKKKRQEVCLYTSAHNEQSVPARQQSRQGDRSNMNPSLSLDICLQCIFRARAVTSPVALKQDARAHGCHHRFHILMIATIDTKDCLGKVTAEL